MNFSRTFGLVAVFTVASALSAHALDDARQILTAGSSQGQGTVQFTGPGMSNVYTPDFPNTGLGEQAASIRFPAGSLSNLRVNVVTSSAPSSGMFRARVRINGADTTLSCMVTGTGICTRVPAIVVHANDLVTLKVENTFVGSGSLAWTASMEFD